jgi:hypothetical protein
MQPAPSEAFDVPEWTEAKVHPDHHIQVRRALYSVPWPHVSHRVDVRIDRSTVRVYTTPRCVSRSHPSGRTDRTPLNRTHKCDRGAALPPLTTRDAPELLLPE